MWHVAMLVNSSSLQTVFLLPVGGSFGAVAKAFRGLAATDAVDEALEKPLLCLTGAKDGPQCQACLGEEATKLITNLLVQASELLRWKGGAWTEQKRFGHLAAGGFALSTPCTEHYDRFTPDAADSLVM